MIDYYDINFNFIRSFYPLSKDDYDKIINISEPKEFKAGTKLVRYGEISKKVFLVNKGVLRSYITMENGRELTKTLFTPSIFLASYTSMLIKKPSEFIYEALTDSHVYEIDYHAFQDLCNTNLEILKFYSKYMEHLFMHSENVFLELSLLDAKQRYLKLRKQIPNIDHLIPQYQIASYLNVSPVQLSRIRAKL